MVAWCRRRRAGNAGIVRALFNRQGVAIAGRDGTLAQTGGTGSTALHPTYGSVQSSGALISHSLAIPGVGTLPMSFAQGARANLWQTPVSVAGVTMATSGLARTLTENAGASADHSAFLSLATTLTDGVTYALRAIVSVAPGSLVSRHAVVTAQRTGQRAGFILDTGTGAVTVRTQGGGSVSSLTSVNIGSGKWLVTCLITNAAWGGILTTVLSLSETYPTADVDFTGDGVSGIAFEAVTLEAATFSGLGLAEGATRAADNILWTPPSALSTTSGEVVAIAAPYLWSAGVGVAHPGTTGRKVHNANASIHRTTSDVAVKADGGTQTASVSALADTTGVLRLVSQKWDGSALSLYQGATLAASDATLSAPWGAVSTLVMGGTATPSENWYGFVGAIYAPGGLTDAERIALASVTGGSLTYVG